MHTESSKAAHKPGSKVRESDERKILRALEDRELTIRQLSAEIGKVPGTVSARLDSLKRKGLINDYMGKYHIVPVDFQNKVGEIFRRHITIQRAKTLLNDLEFLPPYLIDACNRFLMDNGEKPKIQAEPDKFTESKRVFPEFEPIPEKFLKRRPTDKFTGL